MNNSAEMVRLRAKTRTAIEQLESARDDANELLQTGARVRFGKFTGMILGPKLPFDGHMVIEPSGTQLPSWAKNLNGTVSVHINHIELIEYTQ